MEKIPTIKFRDDSLETLANGLAQKDISNLLYARLLKSIQDAVKKKKKECVICFVGDYVITITEDKYFAVLSKVEHYFVGLGEFEKCSEIRDLRKKIKDEQD